MPNFVAIRLDIDAEVLELRTAGASVKVTRADVLEYWNTLNGTLNQKIAQLKGEVRRRIRLKFGDGIIAEDLVDLDFDGGLKKLTRLEVRDREP